MPWPLSIFLESCHNGIDVEVPAASQEVTGESVTIAFVDQGYTGEQSVQDTAAPRVQLEVAKLAEAQKGFVLLPRQWVVERSSGWAARFRRLAQDYERSPETQADLHFLAFTILLLKRFVELMMQSP